MFRSSSDRSQGVLRHTGLSKTHEFWSYWLNLIIHVCVVYFCVIVPEDHVKKVEKFPINSPVYVKVYFW